ncbi:MAG: c-type cytochrome [Burkholderiales bacterium]|jgi:cytochrome c556
MRHPAFAAATLAAALLASPFAVQAQFAKSEDAIKYRQGAFTVMAAHFGRIGAMVNGRVPYDAKAAAENAAVVAAVSRLPMSAFGPGTDTGREHRAKPEVWRDAAKFQAAGDKMVEATARLSAAAGDPAALKTAFGAVAASCKACHDDFRKD